MAAKIRNFAVSPFVQGERPYNVQAHSRFQLQKRLAERLNVSEVQIRDVVDALWRGRPVLLGDRKLVLLPGDFDTVSYQVLPSLGHVN